LGVWEASVLEGMVGILFKERLTFFLIGGFTVVEFGEEAGGLLIALLPSIGFSTTTSAWSAIFFLIPAPIEQEKQVE
jgi:hypothetical protein